MQRASWYLAVAALGLAISPVWAQRRGASPDSVAPAPPTPPAVAETASLAEQLRVLKALNPLSLSTEQMQSLLGLLKPGRQKLEQQDQANVRQMAAVIPQLRQALNQAVAQPNQTTSAELEFRRVREMDNQSRDRVRNQLRDDVRKLFETNLSPEQRNAVIAAGHVLNVHQRVQEMTAGDRGPIDGVARQLDQLRQADARTFQQQRQMFAMREANVPNFWVAFQGNQGGPGGRGGGQSGVAGQGGPRGQGGQGGQRGQGNQGAPGGRADQGGGRGGRGGAPDALQQEQLRQQLNDPTVQARMRPFLSMADQIRRIPMASFQQQRMKLALQVWQTSEEQRVSTNPQASIDFFITQILLLPGAVDVLEAKLKGNGTG